MKSAFYGRGDHSIEVTQILIDEVLENEHKCTCGDCDIVRLAKFLTEHRGEEAFILTVR